ncbi:copper resistance system multicopper oxidase [Okeania sp. SIO1I7]|uniref:copper resistance system multicopper oxidase n=1 Tax=Okeania sp. SIO1I7 TaxID=2607772 RepID=UPI0013FBAADB|nr:copper resistance system multicopper oxidase [Okeania sp. SIO1I7]NET30137.1 copper resistance system multicopper oxidase [Okeania sp. SIO1I7]
MKTNPLNRRNFLRFTAGIGIVTAIDNILPAYDRQTIAASEPVNGNKYPDLIKLQIQETKLKIGERKAIAMTVDGAIPGPLIRLREGQTATIQVTNNLKTDTSIHWHGIILPPEMDGVPGLSFAGIKPGETFTYRFAVNQSGTYWYHSHSGLQEQLGHFGAMIIDPAEPEPIEYDREYAILLSDWTFENPHQVLANLKRKSTYYNYQRRTVGNLVDDLDWRRMRMDPTDIADITGATYTYLMNGMAPESNWSGIFKPGEKVRLRFINASAMTFFDVRIPGLKMTVVQADGQNVQPVTVDEFRIAIAETYDVIVEPEAETAYTIFAETMDRSGYARGTLAPRLGMTAPLPERRKRPLRTMADMGHDHGMDHSAHSQNSPNMNEMEHSQHNSGMDHSQHNSEMDHSQHNSGMDHSQHNSGMDHSTETETIPHQEAVMHGPDHHGSGSAGVAMMSKSRLHEPGIGLENTGTRVLLYTDLRSLKPREDQRKAEREIELHLTGNMERYMWSFDGKKYSEAKEPIQFYNGERLRLTFVNDTMMEHPIHLHGMWMELDNGAGAYKPRKHTVLVKPAERMSVDVTVDAPGNWAFHCHLLYHMKVGMFRVVSVTDKVEKA